MCGRYASSRQPDELVAEFGVQAAEVPVLAPDYNVAPTKEVYAVLERPPRDGAGPEEAHAERQLRVLRWGLVPSWAKDPSVGNRMINARVETIATKPSFRSAFRKRRAILPADGYYEWYPTQEKTSSGKVRKQPFFIHPRDGSVLAMAGLYEVWRDPTRDEDDPKRWRWTCTVITTTATDELGRIHERMPLMLDRSRYDAWLDPALSDPDRLTDLLRPASPDLLEAYPVSSLVSSVRNNGPELIAPLPPEEA